MDEFTLTVEVTEVVPIFYEPTEEEPVPEDVFTLPEEPTHAEVEPVEVITDVDRLLYNGLPVNLGGHDYEVFLAAVDMVGADRFLGSDGTYTLDLNALSLI